MARTKDSEQVCTRAGLGQPLLSDKPQLLQLDKNPVMAAVKRSMPQAGHQKHGQQVSCINAGPFSVLAGTADPICPESYCNARLEHQVFAGLGPEHAGLL